MSAPGESELHAMKEIESWMRHRDELVWRLAHEPLIRQHGTRRTKSHFWRTR
jgi:hypothetical protein